MNVLRIQKTKCCLKFPESQRATNRLQCQRDRTCRNGRTVSPVSAVRVCLDLIHLTHVELHTAVMSSLVTAPAAGRGNPPCSRSHCSGLLSQRKRHREQTGNHLLEQPLSAGAHRNAAGMRHRLPTGCPCTGDTKVNGSIPWPVSLRLCASPPQAAGCTWPPTVGVGSSAWSCQCEAACRSGL